MAAPKLVLSSPQFPAQTEFGVMQMLRSEWSMRAGNIHGRNPFDLPGPHQNMVDFHLVGSACAVFLRVIQEVVTSMTIVPAPGADLTAADVEILERAYTAIGAELDKRKGMGV